MTPFASVESAAQQNYNHSHTRTRTTIEKTFGILKSRFRCLHKSGGSLQYTPAKAAKITVACMLLHNRCIDRNIPMPDDLVEEENLMIDAIPQQGVTAGQMRLEGRARRNNIVQQYFS